MSVDAASWTARKRLKHSLLRRAFNEGRGSEVILLIQWRLSLERHKNAAGVEAAQAFEQDNAGQPRALRALNLLSAKLGLGTVYKDTVLQHEQAQLTLKQYFSGLDEKDRIVVLSRHPMTNGKFMEPRPETAEEKEDRELEEYFEEDSKNEIFIDQMEAQSRHIDIEKAAEPHAPQPKMLLN